MKFRKTVLFVLLFCMLLSAVSAAYAAGYRLKESVSGNERVSYTYNSDGTLAKESHASGGEEYGTVEYSYAKDHTLAEKAVSMGFGTLIFHYDSNGTQIELENPGVGGDVFLMDSESISTERNQNGNVTMITIHNSYEGDKVYYYFYDEAGRIKTFEYSGARRDTFEYKSSGEFTRTSYLFRDNTTTVRERYNAKGQLIESTDQYGNIYTYEYNNNGQLAVQHMTGGVSFSYRYETDANGNVIRMTRTFSEGGEQVTEYKYEKVG